MGLAPSLADPGADAPTSNGWTVGRVITVIAVLALVGFWAWIFAGGPEKANPDYLSDRAFAEWAQDRCATTNSRIDDLQPARDATSAGERADVIDQASDELAHLVDDLEARAPTTGDDATRMRGWIKDWRTWIQDRRRYTVALRANPRAQFLVSTNQAGDSVDRPIKNFADINDIPECDPPLDVG
jgi:hypothetical protein